MTSDSTERDIAPLSDRATDASGAPTATFFYTDAHWSALDRTVDGLADGKPIVALIGPKGAGKTAIAKQAISQLPETLQAVYASAKGATADILVSRLSDALGAEAAARSAETPDEALRLRLAQLAAANRRVALILDDADALSDAALEDLPKLAALGSLDDGRSYGVQVMLVGAPSLGDRLAASASPVLGEASTSASTLRLLSRDETVNFLKQRLDLGSDAVDEDAAAQAMARTAGAPALLDALADRIKALRAAEPTPFAPQTLSPEEIDAAADALSLDCSAEALGVDPEILSQDLHAAPIELDVPLDVELDVELDVDEQTDGREPGAQDPSQDGANEVDAEIASTDRPRPMVRPDEAAPTPEAAPEAEAPTKRRRRRGPRLVDHEKRALYRMWARRAATGVAVLVLGVSAVSLAMHALESDGVQNGVQISAQETAGIVAGAEATAGIDAADDAAALSAAKMRDAIAKLGLVDADLALLDLDPSALEGLDIEPKTRAALDEIRALRAQLEAQAAEGYERHRGAVLDVMEDAFGAAETAARTAAASVPGPVGEAAGALAVTVSENRATLRAGRELEALGELPPEEASARRQGLVDGLFETFDARLDAEQFTRPIGVSAYDALLEAERLSPNDARVEAAATRLIEIYETRARLALEESKFEEYYSLIELVDRIRARTPI